MTTAFAFNPSKSIGKSSRFNFDYDQANSNASILHRRRDNLVQQVPSREKQVRTL